MERDQSKEISKAFPLMPGIQEIAKEGHNLTHKRINMYITGDSNLRPGMVMRRCIFFGRAPVRDPGRPTLRDELLEDLLDELLD